jgi:hypothetical protein
MGIYLVWFSKGCTRGCHRLDFAVFGWTEPCTHVVIARCFDCDDDQDTNEY